MRRGEHCTKIFEKSLRELERLFRTRGSLTARQVTEVLGCARNTAHKRLDELRERGIIVIRRGGLREGASGPKSTLYVIAVDDEKRKRA